MKNDKKNDLNIFFDMKINAIFVELIIYYITWIWLNRIDYLQEDLMFGEYLKILIRFDEIND